MFNTHNCRPPTYLNIDLITCKVLGFLNLHRIYRNLHKFTPLFEKFTKIYVIYSVNWIWHPAPHPLFPGLSSSDHVVLGSCKIHAAGAAWVHDSMRDIIAWQQCMEKKDPSTNTPRTPVGLQTSQVKFLHPKYKQQILHVIYRPGFKAGTLKGCVSTLKAACLMD